MKTYEVVLYIQALTPHAAVNKAKSPPRGFHWEQVTLGSNSNNPIVDVFYSDGEKTEQYQFFLGDNG